MNDFLKNKDRALKKWRPIIDNMLLIKNIELLTNICIYCEWYNLKIYEVLASPVVNGNTQVIHQTNDEEAHLSTKVKEILQKVKNSTDRIEIVGSYLNIVTGAVEYKLENGEFIEENYELSDENLIKLFGLEFIKDVYIEKYRNINIDKILE